MKITRKISSNLHFFPFGEHGGLSAQGKRKVRRPLSAKKPLLLVLKTGALANRYHLHQKNNSREIEGIVKKQAKKFRIRLLEERMERDSVKLLLRFLRREEFQQFLRSVTAMIARKISGARKGHPFGKFWLALAYSRIVRTRQEMVALKSDWHPVRNAYLDFFLRFTPE